MKAFDLHRMAFDKVPFDFLGEVALRSLYTFVLVFLFLKMTGRRGVRQMSLFEVLIILTLGSAAGDVAFYDDVPMVPDVGMFASFDPVALDLACIEAVNRQPILPGSALAERGDPHDHDHLHAAHPDTCWQAAIEHGKKIGLGTDNYTLITVK